MGVVTVQKHLQRELTVVGFEGIIRFLYQGCVDERRQLHCKTKENNSIQLLILFIIVQKAL